MIQRNRYSFFLLALVLAAPCAQAALRLPLRHYTSADGLSQDGVATLAFDTQGFLWIGTDGGLCRFDGEQFTRFGTADGLQGHFVNAIALGPEGTHWVATERGLFVFRPAEVAPPGRLFREVSLEGVPDRDQPYRLLLDRAGTLWVGTVSSHLWRVTPSGDGYRVLAVPLAGFIGRVQTLAEDPSGAIWVGTHSVGIYRVSRDGRVDHCPAEQAGAAFVRGFHFAKDGSVWTTFFGGVGLGGVAIFDRPPFGDQTLPPRLYGPAQGMEIDTGGMLPIGDDRILVATTVGVIEMRRSGPGPKDWEVGPTLDRRSGLPQDPVRALALGPSGHLWLGLFNRGLVKLLRNGFSTIVAVGGAGTNIVDLAPDSKGRLVVLANRGAMELMADAPETDPAGPYRVSLPPSLGYVGWGAGQKMLVDRRGSWWIATGAGALRYDDPGGMGARRLTRPPDAVYARREGLSGNDAYVLLEDARGDVWISTNLTRPASSTVSRWSRTTETIENFPASAVATTSLADHFLLARDASLWIHFLDGTLVRARGESFQTVLKDSYLTDLFQDGRGRLWSVGPALRLCENPEAIVPTFLPVDVPGEAEGITYHCGVEGDDRRIWLGTNQGLVAFAPDTRQVRRFTVEDGLVGNSILYCARDGTGALWFSDGTGLSKVEAVREQPPGLPRARLREVRVAGEAVPLPSMGADEVGPVRIPADRRRLSLEFFAADLGAGSPVRFQHRLDGAGQEWSPPSLRREVQYASLTPGRYRFQVRTISEAGETSPDVASVALVVLAPVWQRAWFLALCLSAATALVYAAHRTRVRRAIALERVRTRIATDLHDDVGSSLSQIAILSQLTGRRPELQERITALAGEVVDAMGDVVWAISPRSDTVAALVTRMRRFASELFADDAVALELALPEEREQPMDPEARRQLYLVFKEALHNVKRHAGARRVRVALSGRGGEWILTVDEDGRGFDPERESAGQGMASMRQRAERLGGRLEVTSSPEGTRLTLTIPGGSGGKLWNR